MLKLRLAMGEIGGAIAILGIDLGGGGRWGGQGEQ